MKDKPKWRYINKIKIRALAKLGGTGIKFVPKFDDSVNHPNHYGGEHNPYEAIKVIRAWQLGFNLGNTVKYISRAGKKDTSKLIEDLKKARWYLNDEINELETKELEKIILEASQDVNERRELHSSAGPRVRASGGPHGERPERGARGTGKLRSSVARRSKRK